MVWEKGSLPILRCNRHSIENGGHDTPVVATVTAVASIARVFLYFLFLYTFYNSLSAFEKTAYLVYLYLRQRFSTSIG